MRDNKETHWVVMTIGMFYSGVLTGSHAKVLTVAVLPDLMDSTEHNTCF